MFSIFVLFWKEFPIIPKFYFRKNFSGTLYLLNIFNKTP